MPAHRSGGPVTPPSNDDLDRELAAALAVEPSAAFLARVRTRIASEPEPPVWGVWRMLAAASACAVVLALAATQLNQAALPPGPDRVPLRSRAFPELSLVLPTIMAAPFAGTPLVMASSAPRRVQRPTPEMQAIMQSNADADTLLRAHLKERDYVAIARDAATFKQNFAYVAVFWANQKVDDALALSTRGLSSAMDLEAAALVEDDGAVEKAVTALTDTCGACHKGHREQLPDKTYAISL